MAEMKETPPQRITPAERLTPPQEKHFSFKSTVNGFKKAGQAAALGFFLSGAVTACSGGEKEYHPVTKNTPPPAGVDVVHQTETPMPSQTATIESTRTPRTTATPEIENINQGYQIELDDQLKTLEAEGKTLPSGLTVKQYQAKIQEEVNKFPKIGDLVIKLYLPAEEAIQSSQANDYFLGKENGGPKILLRADRRGDIKATISLAELDHEMGGHYFSISANGQYWQDILTSDEYDQVKQIEDEATHDPNYGLAGSQDAFAEYFSDKMRGATEYPQPDASIADQMASSRKRMLEIELSGLASPADETPNPFLPLIQTQLDEIHTYASSAEMQQKADYIKDAVAILDKNQAIVDKISAENPLMAQVYKRIRENGSALTEQNLSRTSSASDTFKMSGFTKGEAFENLSKWGAVIFLEKDFKEGDLIIVGAYKDKTAEISQFIKNKDLKARKENVADQIKVQMRVPGAHTPAAKLLTLFRNASQRSSR